MINQGNDSANDIKLDHELDRLGELGNDFLDEADQHFLQLKTEYLKETQKMKKIEVEVKAKIGALEIPKSFDYEEPEDWEEAVKMEDGDEETCFKTYLIKRKTNFQDKKRAELVKKATKGLGKLSAEKLRELGLDI